MTPDKQPEGTPERPAAEASGASAEDRRVAARRRFLRGASGGAALVLTVPHRRAFATKKATLLSNCTSLQGTPDLKSVKDKKALEVSAMGTPKGAFCRLKTDPPPQACTLAMDGANPKLSTYYKTPDPAGQVPYYYHNLQNGCGTALPGGLPQNNTIDASHNYRLYEKGYCPLKWDNGLLKYDLNATYYEKKGADFILKACEGP